MQNFISAKDCQGDEFVIPCSDRMFLMQIKDEYFVYYVAHTTYKWKVAKETFYKIKNSFGGYIR